MSKNVSLVTVLLQVASVIGLLIDYGHKSVYIAMLILSLLLQLVCKVIVRIGKGRGGLGEKPKVAIEAPRPFLPSEPPSEKPIVESYFERYIKYIAAKHGEKAASDTREDVEALMGNGKEKGRIESIAEENDGRVKGLVVGRVQSGKTQNYAGVILKAIDDKYNAIIVLTSNNVELAEQTRNRFVGDEGCFKCVGLTEDKYVEVNFLNGDAGRRFDAIDDGKVFFGIAQKEQLKDGGHLPAVKRWLQGAGEYSTSLRVLIIDDEADVAQNSKAGTQALSISAISELCKSAIKWESGRGKALADWIKWLASGAKNLDDDICEQLRDACERCKNNEMYEELITKNLEKETEELSSVARKLISDSWNDKRSGAFGAINDFFVHHSTKGNFVRLMKYAFDERERTVINKSIVEICDVKCGRMAYLGYTATPFANLGNETPQENPLYPQFVQSMQVSPEYFGFKQMFGDKVEEVEKSPFVRIIPESDRSDYIQNANYDIANWSSLKDALSWAVISASCRGVLVREKYIKPATGKITTMFINIDRTKKSHAKLLSSVKKWFSDVAYDNSRWNEFKTGCKRLWRSEVGKTNIEVVKQWAREFPYEKSNDGKGVRDWRQEDWSLVAEGIENFRGKNVEVIALNSDEDNEEDAEKYRMRGNVKNDTLWVICGGNTISRGLTLDGLTTSYYDRVGGTTCVDTMSQMGRWFGFRSGYELLPRVWMPADTARLMVDAGENERRLHEDLQEGFSAGCDTTDPNYYQPLYACVQRLTGRDAALIRNGEFRVCDTTVAISLDENCIKNIWALLEKNVSENFHGKYFERNEADYPYARFPYWRNVHATSVKAFLSSIAKWSPKETMEMLGGIGDFAVQSENIDVSWDVVIADIENKNDYIDIGARKVRPSNTKAEINGDVAYYYKKTNEYLSYIAAYSGEQLNEIDQICEKNYGKKLRRGANFEYRDIAYAKIGDNHPKLQIFLERIEYSKIPLVKIAFEWPGKRSVHYRTWVLGSLSEAAGGCELEGSVSQKKDNESATTVRPKEECRGAQNVNSDKIEFNEDQRDKIKNALQDLASKTCPWYLTKDLDEKLRELLPGFKGKEYQAIIRMIDSFGWKRHGTDRRNGIIYYPGSFSSRPDGLEKVREMFIGFVVDYLENKGAPVSGKGCWNDAKKRWNEEFKDGGNATYKINDVITANNTLPSSPAPDSVTQLRVEKAQQKLRNVGVHCELIDGEYMYSLKENLAAAKQNP